MATAIQKAVLVVEDEGIIRLDLVIALEELGFRVWEAPSAEAALVVLDSRDDIGIVVTDINMTGGMDGLALLREVRRRWPPIHLIVTSAGRVLRSDEMPERTLFLPKPVGIHKLAAVIRERLHAND